MKKSIIIFGAVISSFCLMAFGYVKWNNAHTKQSISYCNKTADFDNIVGMTFNKEEDLDLLYKIDSRFLSHVTKEQLHNAKSIIDILPKKATRNIDSYQYARVSILEGPTETDQSSIGDNEFLTADQIKVLRLVDYSTNIYIRSDYKIKNEYTGKLENEYLTYFISVIPEQEAEYEKGYDVLIDYLKQNTKEETAIIEKDGLKPGKVNFTITQDGSITNVNLSSTSGYESVDKTLVELIASTSGKWNPATNSKGEKVEQELIFFFGLAGC